MNKMLKIFPMWLLCWWGASEICAQSVLPKYFEIDNGAEWTSQLLTFDEPIEGFRLTVFKTNLDSHKYNGFPFVTLAEVDINDADGNEITYTATTNSLAADDGNGLAGLCDNDTGDNGHYHSAYSGHATIAPTEYVYIEFTFDEPQTAFTYRQVRRNNLYDYPIHFTLSALGEKGKKPFNPTNPSEPGTEEVVEEVTYYSVTTQCDPASVAYVTAGGQYVSGYAKYYNTYSRNANYVFSHWTLNGEHYSDNASFTYTVGEENANLVAHYTFDPSSPTEPQPTVEVVVSPLYLATNVEGACTFNQVSGNEYEEETWVAVEAIVADGYTFSGWYEGATFLTSSTAFNYQMPGEAVTLTAHVAKVIFNPENPSEPESDGSQTDVMNSATGDVNKDGVINVLDVTAVIARSLDAEATELGLYDVNSDGVVNVLDVTKIIELSLQQ